MKPRKRILITGITGFLGSFLAKELLKKGHTIYGLARPSVKKTALERTQNALAFAFDEEWDPMFMNRVRVVEGDINNPQLSIPERSIRNRLARRIDTIFHCAALAELNCPYQKIKKINVDGTRHVLDFAKEIKDKGRPIRFNHISTMYICGKGIEEFNESMFDEGQSFNNTYEQTKFEAEGLVREYMRKEGLPCSIFRPSMIIGESTKGRTSNFRLIYQPLHFLVNEIYDKFPANLECGQNLIHMDTVAEAIAHLSEFDHPDVYHIISPNDVKVRTFINTAAEFFNFDPPELIPVEDFDWSCLTPARRALAEPFVPYFNHKTVFQKKRNKMFVGKKLFLRVDMKKLNLIYEYYINHNVNLKKYVSV